MARKLKTHCKQGHEFTEENTYVTPQGWRQCRVCNSAAWRRHYDRNRDALAERRRNRYAQDEEHRAEILVSNRDWASRNPDKVNEISRVKKHRRRAAGELSVSDWQEVLEQHGTICLACGDADREVTIDHIVPVSKGGTNSKDNLQPLCGSCNSSKADKTLDYRSTNAAR